MSLTRKGSEEHAKSEDIAQKIAFNEQHGTQLNADLSQVLAQRLRGHVGDGGEADIANQWREAEKLEKSFVDKMLAVGTKGSYITPDTNQPAETPETLRAKMAEEKQQVIQQGGEPLPKTEFDIREWNADEAARIKRLQALGLVTPGTPTKNASLETKVNEAIDKSPQTIKEHQEAREVNPASSPLPPSAGDPVAAQAVKTEVAAEQKKHEGLGGTTGVVMEKLGDKAGEAGLRGYDRFRDPNYDPKKVAANPLGMYDPDRVKQAQEDLKLPQYQKK